ncbi:MAG: hypothetical protein ABI977_12260 [Acidobacteriota bacterium]
MGDSRANKQSMVKKQELKNNPDLETVRGEKAYKPLIEALSKISSGKSANTTGGTNAGSR